MSVLEREREREKGRVLHTLFSSNFALWFTEVWHNWAFFFFLSSLLFSLCCCLLACPHCSGFIKILALALTSALESWIGLEKRKKEQFWWWVCEKDPIFVANAGEGKEETFVSCMKFVWNNERWESEEKQGFLFDFFFYFFNLSFFLFGLLLWLWFFWLFLDLQLSWSKSLVRKWFNIKSKAQDFYADYSVGRGLCLFKIHSFFFPFFPFFVFDS